MPNATDPVEESVETIGLRFQDQQLPRIAGRLFGLLLMEGGPFSFSELAERLQVSRGSISVNARLLTDMGLIERVSKPGDRQDHYRIQADGLASLFRRHLATLRWSDSYYRKVAERLPAHRGDAKRRLISSTLLTLIIVPVLLSYIDSLTRRVARFLPKAPDEHGTSAVAVEHALVSGGRATPHKAPRFFRNPF